MLLPFHLYLFILFVGISDFLSLSTLFYVAPFDLSVFDRCGRSPTLTLFDIDVLLGLVVQRF